MSKIKCYKSEFHEFASRFTVLLLLAICLTGVSAGIGSIKVVKKHYTINEPVDLICEYNDEIGEGDRFILDILSKYNNTDKKREITVNYNDPLYNKETKSFRVELGKLELGSYDITCNIQKYGRSKSGIDTVDIYVGTKPQPIENFNCINYAFDFLKCTFDEPYNPVETNYSVEVRIGNQNKKNCTLVKKNETKYECSVTEGTPETGTPYTFIVSSINPLSEGKFLVERFEIDILNVTLPPRVDLKLEQTTISTADFNYTLDNSAHYEHNRERNYLIYNVTLESKAGVHLSPKDFQFDIKIIENTDNFSLKLRNLPYPSYTYKVTLRMKMVLSSNKTDMYYSEPSTYTFTTKPTLPYRPPKTNLGAFSIQSFTDRHIKIFWESLKDYEENGKNFSYYIKVYRNGVPVKLKLIQKTSFSATFDTNKILADYKFEIFSRNEIGDSVNSSIIFVSKQALIQENLLEDVWKVTSNDTSSNLTWALKKPEDFENFTIYWCSSKYSAPAAECDSSIGFVEVPKEERAHIFQENRIPNGRNYGVSMNFKNYSSGIVWTSCEARDNMYLEKVNFDAKPDKRDMRLSWNMDCTYKSLSRGYNLTYCRIDGNGECVGEVREEILGNKLESYEVGGLKPYSKYKVWMNMFRDKNGPVSYETLKTLQDVPTPPRKLTFANVTSSSVFLSWVEPEEMNGVFMKYKIYVNGVVYNDTKETKIVLNNLKGHISYNISVVAVTIGESKPISVLVKTLIGAPSIPKNEKVFPESVSWDKPDDPNGNVDFYEVKMGDKISFVRNMSCALNYCDGSSQFNLQIRAVNVFKDNSESEFKFVGDPLCGNDDSKSIIAEFQKGYTFLKSPPLEAPQYQCPKFPAMALFGILSACIIVPSILAMTIYKVRKMADLKPVLPPGLGGSSSPAKANGPMYPNDDVESEQTLETTDNESSTLTGKEYMFQNSDFEEIMTEKPKQQFYNPHLTSTTSPVIENFSPKEVTGYIKIQPSSEYIKPNTCGYVTLGELTKPKKESEYYPIETEESSMPAPLMSGYVTPGGNFYK